MMDRLQDFLSWFSDQSFANRIGIIIGAAIVIILIVFLLFNLVFADSPLSGDALVQYKASCNSVGYQELSGNINKYSGQHVKFTGQVVSINPINGKTQMVLSVTPVNGGWSTTDLIFVTYNTQTAFKAGDIVTVYGDVAGTYNYVSISNGQLIIPKITARYVEATTIAYPSVVGVPFTSPTSNGSNGSSNSNIQGNITPINSTTTGNTANVSNGQPV